MKISSNIKLIIIILALISIPIDLKAQDFFRFKADFTIKGKQPDNSSQLTLGKVYYDKNIKKIVFDISFPKKEVWVQQDTTIYKFVNDTLIDKQSSLDITEFTIYHLALNGNLSDYGLKGSVFDLINVEKEGDKVISTWEAPQKYKKFLSKIMTLKKGNLLRSIVFFDNDGNVFTRQFYNKYTNIDGLNFPTEIIIERTIDKIKYYQITTYENIIINDLENNEKYDYKIPKL